MVPYGLTESTGNLQIKKKPEKSELETYCWVGLMVAADGENNLKFNISWSMVDIDLWFRRLLPKLFEWLDACHGALEFHWVLLNSDHQNHFVLTWPTITGKELDKVKGNPGRRFTSYSIAITPWIPILHSVYSNQDAAVWKALSRSTPTGIAHHGDIAETLTISDSESEVDSHSAVDDISKYSTDIEIPGLAQKKDMRKGKAAVAPTNPEISELDDSELASEIIAGGATSRDSAMDSDLKTDSSGTTAAQSNTMPRVFTDLPLLLVGSYYFESNSGAPLPVIGTQNMTPTATQARVGLKCHASAVFETNTSGPASGGKRIKSDNYRGCMSPVHELGTSIDFEFPQATASGSSAAHPDRRPSALHPTHKPTRNPWA